MAERIRSYLNNDPEQKSISELLEEEDWDQVLIRLDKMRFYLFFTDRKMIMNSLNAPDWLKTAAWVCKTLPSC